MHMQRCLVLFFAATALMTAQPADQLPFGKIIHLEGPLGLRDGRGIVNQVTGIADLSGRYGTTRAGRLPCVAAPRRSNWSNGSPMSSRPRRAMPVRL